MTTLLMETIHGSRLYGLEHADSDFDVYRVWSGKGKMQHVHEGKNDAINKSLDSFLTEVYRGIPQALEALWSQNKTVNAIDHLKVHPSFVKMISQYQERIEAFWCDGGFKNRRHAARLYLNAKEYMEFGEFNPRLSDVEVKFVNLYANYATLHPML